jgi:tetratricopeptide (TPR) repeat protein
MKTAKNFGNPKFFPSKFVDAFPTYFLLLILNFGGLAPYPSLAAEPLMDISLFTTDRIGAINSVKEGNFTQALQAEQTALKIAQDQHGPTSPSLVPILNDEAILQWHLAQYRDSEENFKWGLALLEKNLGPDDPQVADSLDLLAGLYLDLNRLEEAKLLERRALALRQTPRAENPQTLARSQLLMGRIELGLKDPSQAQALFLEAQRTLEKASRPDPSLSLSLWKDLAVSCSSQKNFSQTQTCLEKALEAAQKNFSTESIQEADAMEDLADFYRDRGDTSKAQPLDESALKTTQRFVGTDYDYQALPYVRRLVKIYRATDKNQPAADLLKKILQTERSILGPQHPRVSLDRLQLAEIESSLGHKPKAIQDAKESLANLGFFFPQDHPLVLQAKGLLKKLSNQ